MRNDDKQAERQALREREAEAVRTGQKTRAQVKRERELRAARARGTAVPAGEKLPRQGSLAALAERVVGLIGDEPWLSTTQVAHRLHDRRAWGLLPRMCRLGMLRRETGRGPRGGNGYCLNVPSTPDWRPAETIGEDYSAL